MDKILIDAIKKINIELEDEVISAETILEQLELYMTDQVMTEESQHGSGFVFHTGSNCYDAIILSFAFLDAMTKSSVDANELVHSLKPGDMVIRYEGRRQYRKKFIEIKVENNIEYVVLDSGTSKFVTSDLDKLSPVSWHKIKKYYGDSITTDGRGIKKESKELQDAKKSFAKLLTGVEDPGFFDGATNSIVLCMSKDRAEYLLENLSFGFTIDNKKVSVKLKDIATATFYTEKNDYPLGRNPTKAEAVIQVTSDPYVARQLIRTRTKNHKTGIIISGNGVVKRGPDDVYDLIHSELTDFSVLSININSIYTGSIVKQFNDTSLFACTKDFLRLYGNMISYPDNKVIAGLRSEIYWAMNNKIIVEELHSSLDRNKCFEIKNLNRIISKDAYESEQKDKFVIYTYSMLNLFLRSAFTIEDMDATVENNSIERSRVEDRINDLRRWSEEFPDNIKDLAKTIIGHFEDFYCNSYDYCSKKDYLTEFLNKNPGKRIAIIVDKKYYIRIIKESWFDSMSISNDSITITTALGFDCNRVYDYVISVGFIKNKKVNLLDFRNAYKTIFLVYPFENELLKINRKKHIEFNNALNDSSFVPISTKESQTDDLFESSEAEKSAYEADLTDDETEDLIEKLERKYNSERYYVSSGSSGGVTAKAVKFATLGSGEAVFFSERYKAYKYDEFDNSISEIDVDSISSGDSLVFTQYNSETKDIVELIIKQRLEENKYSNEMTKYIKMSKRWKETLKQYKAIHDLKPKEFAARIKEYGCTVNIQTIKYWFDEDSHTICPRSLSSLEAIGLACEDQSLSDNAKAYYEACKEVKSLRRDILKEIAQAIRKKVCGMIPDKTDSFYDVFSKFDDLVSVETVLSITDTDRECPLNRINRPINKIMR